MANYKLSDSKKWENTCDRFIAFIDIMGFKDFVARRSHNELYEKMSAISDIVRNVDKIENDKNPRYADKVHITTFSDSIIIFSKDNNVSTFDVFSHLTAWIFNSIIKKSFPIKGAVAHGKITVNKSNRIYFGQPLIDAFELQEDVFYYGLTAHHSIEEYIKNNHGSDYFNELYFDIETPLKSGKVKHYNIDWFNFDLNENKNSLDVKTEILETVRNFRINTSGRPRIYIDNTINIIDEKNSPF